MLNPSTADGDADDPTIRRCVDFAQRWGFGGIVVVNMFALRSTDPQQLLTHPDPVGRDNTKVLLSVLCADEVGPVVAAWGANPAASGDQALVLRRLLEAVQVFPQCLGVTKEGHPRHPLYVPATTALQPFQEAP